MSSDYDWNKNMAVVDRVFYMQYIKIGTTAFFGALALKDLWFIRINWFADRAQKRLPIVISLF